MAQIYRKHVDELHKAPTDEATQPEAAEIIRSLVEGIALTPEDTELKIDRRGDLSADAARDNLLDAAKRRHIPFSFFASNSAG